MKSLDILKKKLHAFIDTDESSNPEEFVDLLAPDIKEDVDFLLVKCLFLSHERIFNIDRAIYLINNSSYFRLDPRLLILKVYIERINHGVISDESKKAIEDFLRKPITGYLIFLPYLLSLYYEVRKQYDYQFQFLLKSISIDPNSVYNFNDLAIFYYNRGSYRNAVINIKKSLANIQIVGNEDLMDCYFDTLDFDSVLNEEIAGIYLSSVNYDSLMERGATYTATYKY